MKNRGLKIYKKLKEDDYTKHINGKDLIYTKDLYRDLSSDLIDIARTAGTLLIDDIVIRSRYNLLEYPIDEQKKKHMDVVQIKENSIECWLSEVRRDVILSYLESKGLTNHLIINIKGDMGNEKFINNIIDKVSSICKQNPELIKNLNCCDK